MYQGSCLCQSVRYEIQGDIGPVSYCHCSRCRKANGSAFLAASQVDPRNFTLVSGQENLGDYESSPGVHRMFCKICASPLFSRRPGPPEIIRLRIGTLDTPLRSKPEMHIILCGQGGVVRIQG